MSSCSVIRVSKATVRTALTRAWERILFVQPSHFTMDVRHRKENFARSVFNLPQQRADCAKTNSRSVRKEDCAMKIPIDTLNLNVVDTGSGDPTLIFLHYW